MTVLKRAESRLDGHVLLLLSPWHFEQARLDEIAARFPGLTIIYRETSWSPERLAELVTEEEWKKVTILLTGKGLPKPAQAPKLQYVQLGSAGANEILKTPLFTDTDVAFCTANGVHG
jgi:hypothetical protein